MGPALRFLQAMGLRGSLVLLGQAVLTLIGFVGLIWIAAGAWVAFGLTL